LKEHCKSVGTDCDSILRTKLGGVVRRQRIVKEKRNRL
jgi:hypothetical protein